MADERQCNECGGKLPGDAPQGLCPQCLMKLGLPSEAGGEEPALSDDQAVIPTSATPPGGFVPPQPSQLAEKFPQLEILELLGQGGMGAVYKARQKQLDRLVALKVLPPEAGRDPAFAERFAREARSLAKLNHPRIVSVFDFGHTEDGVYYFVMEFVDGTDLRRVIEGGQLDPAEALAIVPQICEALQYAHEEGLVHRDIKPENILLDKRGRVKIADFGLAKLLGKPTTAYTLTQAGQRMGTPHYMAPEQIEGAHEVDHRADIYSLGVVFYEMLTGELPIGRFSPPSQKVQVDVRLDEIVLHTLEKEPERRYQHASELKTDVEMISTKSKTPVVCEDRIPGKRCFSRAAIVGACCMPLAILLFVPPLVLTDPRPLRSSEFFNMMRETTGGFVLVILFALVGLAASFVTTILGIVSITHIRHSAGRLYGMGLALFDALFFPVLALNIAIIAVLVLAGMGGSEAVILTLVIGGLLDRFIIRWAWRRANAGLEPVQKQTDQTDTDERTDQMNTNSKSNIGTMSLVLAIGGTVLSIAVALLLALIESLTNFMPPYTLCFVLFVALEIAALVTGIIGWRSACGKAGLIISAILLLLSSIVLPASRVSSGPSEVGPFGDKVKR